MIPNCSNRGWLDRLVLMMAPVTLGDGKRLFGDGTPAAAMTLVEQRTTAGGMLMSSYEPSGQLQTGFFATEERQRRS